MNIGCWEVPKPTYPSLLWLAEWKAPAPFKYSAMCASFALTLKTRHFLDLILKAHWLEQNYSRWPLISIYNRCKWLLRNEAKCEFSLMYDGSISHVSDFLSYFLDSNTSTSPSTSCIPRDTKKAGKTSYLSIQDSLQTSEKSKKQT